ncbi:hypothetical protein ACH4MT_22715 [Streptomyces anulatus]|jgi:GH25 family lysozyme M1 (1,4-beta-N-acetylmuramidase)
MRSRTLVRGAAAVVLAPAGLAAATSAAASPRPKSAQADDLAGVDVSNYQVGFDYARAATEGLDFVVAKAGGPGGCQLSEGPYTSDSLRRPHRRSGPRAAVLRVGHYFVDNLHAYRSGDALALDVEVLEDSARRWDDADVSTRLNRVRDQVGAYVPWFYISTSALRSADWGRADCLGRLPSGTVSPGPTPGRLQALHQRRRLGLTSSCTVGGGTSKG